MNGTFLAADFGGGSGRVIAGNISEGTRGKILALREIHRFPNRVVSLGDYLYWDFPALFAELEEGLKKAARNCSDIISVGIDTWGVDFGLIDSLGNLVGNPICYRDPHTLGMIEIFNRTTELEAHYREAGIQILPINTLFRLMSMVQNHDPKLTIARHLLFMPDLFSYFLTGRLGNEYTIASTSELLDARTKSWNKSLIRSIGINPSIFSDIIMPGSSRGVILPQISERTGLNPRVKVIAVGSHDTASAVFAASEPFEETHTAFLSSGTWSLLGVNIPKPILTERARLAEYTNEGSVEGRIRFLTNITGLWILQRLREQWKQAGDNRSWKELIDEAQNSTCDTVIDVDDPMFQKPDNMEGTLREYCISHRLATPATKGDMTRCVCLSLAHRYKKAIDSLNELLPEPVQKIKIFGGGANNTLLNTLTEQITELPVITGPTEATAIGNILVQALAAGVINRKEDITEIIEE